MRIRPQLRKTSFLVAVGFITVVALASGIVLRAQAQAQPVEHKCFVKVGSVITSSVDGSVLLEALETANTKILVAGTCTGQFHFSRTGFQPGIQGGFRTDFSNPNADLDAYPTYLDGLSLGQTVEVFSGVSVGIENIIIRNGSGEGGGIYNEGSVFFTSGILENNDAGIGYGAAIFNAASGDATIAASILRNNSARLGGAVYNEGDLTVNDVDFIGNNSEWSGAAIFNDGGTVSIESSSLEQNVAGDAGGAIASDGAGADVEVIFTTMNDNVAFQGGAIYQGAGSFNLHTSTISGNQASFGGGVSSGGGAMTIHFSTISGNAGGGVRIASGSSLDISHTIIANSSGSYGDCTLLSDTIFSFYNLIEDTGTDACNIQNGFLGNIIGQDPRLGPLALNLGQVNFVFYLQKTHGLLDGSPAIDAGDTTSCMETDQRYTDRPQGTNCDIGAYERRAIDEPIPFRLFIPTIGK